MKTLYMGLPGPELLTHGLSPCVTRLSTIQDAFRDLLRKANFSDRFPLQAFGDIRENVSYCYCLTT